MGAKAVATDDLSPYKPVVDKLGLEHMEREVRAEPTLRRLAVGLCAKWRSLLCHKRMRGARDTNNVTERVIGRSKIRYKTLRGRKSVEGMMNALWLTQRVWESPAWI